MHQEREFPGRVSGTNLVNPDFAALARAYGGIGITVTEDAEIEPAIREALAADKPVIVHLKISPEAITPVMTLTQIREKAIAAGK
jgi:acetolactate synthase-1/2/3 large subunit